VSITGTPPPRLQDNDFPRIFVVSDRKSIAAQNQHVTFARCDLLLVVLAAVAGAFGGLESSSYARYAYVIAALFLMGALSIEILADYRKPENDWYDGRAVAESVKTATWRYMMGADPYDEPDDASDVSFVTVLQQAAEARPELQGEQERYGDDTWAITPAMRRVRSLPFEERRALYLQARARDQQQWYARKSRVNARQAKLWFRVGLAARVLALGGAVFFVIHPAPSGIVELFATAGAAATAWNQLRRHTELTRSYALAAQELESLAGVVEGATDEERFGEAVTETEGAISREHTMWMAKRLEEPPTRILHGLQSSVNANRKVGPSQS